MPFENMETTKVANSNRARAHLSAGHQKTHPDLMDHHSQLDHQMTTGETQKKIGPQTNLREENLKLVKNSSSQVKLI